MIDGGDMSGMMGAFSSHSGYTTSGGTTSGSKCQATELCIQTCKGSYTLSGTDANGCQSCTCRIGKVTLVV